MFDPCHFLKVTFMRVEDVRLTALETGISIYSQEAGKTRAGAGQAPAQMPSSFLPSLPPLCLPRAPQGAADIGSSALPVEMPREEVTTAASHQPSWGRHHHPVCLGAHSPRVINQCAVSNMRRLRNVIKKLGIVFPA